MNAKHTNASARVAWAACAVALLSGGAALAASSPVGTWDFVVSGSQQGVAYLTFNEDYTLTGFQALTYRPQAPDNSGRGLTEPSRTGLNLPVASTDRFFGFTTLSGHWNYDAGGRVVGNMTDEATGEGENTDLSVSFTAKVSPGKRVTLQATVSPSPSETNLKPRKMSYRGVPYQALNSIAGSFLGTAKVAVTTGVSKSVVQKYTEFLSMTNMADLVYGSSGFLAEYGIFSSMTNCPGITNAYFVGGHGPGNANFGMTLLSAQKQIGLVNRIENLSATVVDTNTTFESILRSVAGPINKKNVGNLKGTDSDQSRIKYQLQKYANTAPPADTNTPLPTP